MTSFFSPVAAQISERPRRWYVSPNGFAHAGSRSVHRTLCDLSLTTLNPIEKPDLDLSRILTVEISKHPICSTCLGHPALKFPFDLPRLPSALDRKNQT